MSQNESITAIVAGSMLLATSFISKNFYAAKGIHSASLSDRKVPAWQGHLIFWVVGGIMIFIGVLSLFPSR